LSVAPKHRPGVRRKRGRGAPKPQALVAVARDGGVRITLIPNGKTTTVKPLLDRWLDPSSTLMTDGNKIYKKIGQGYAAHHAVIHSKKQFAIPATGAHINTAEAVVSQVERALVGVYHLLPPEHLQRYLNEVAWRWNHRAPAQKLRKRRSGFKVHTIWQPVRVLQQMRDLLGAAVGKQLRRSQNFGLCWPA
jgi:transposase-like protein